MRLCPKIGCFYITRNNPRELLNIIRELREENYKLKEEFQATSKGLTKAVLKRKKWRTKYDKERKKNRILRKEKINLIKWLEEKKNLNNFALENRTENTYYKLIREVLDKVKGKVK